MLREQRDIYLKLADEALQYTITYERGEERLADALKTVFDAFAERVKR